MDPNSPSSEIFHEQYQAAPLLSSLAHPNTDLLISAKAYYSPPYNRKYQPGTIMEERVYSPQSPPLSDFGTNTHGALLSSMPISPFLSLCFWQVSLVAMGMHKLRSVVQRKLCWYCSVWACSVYE